MAERGSRSLYDTPPGGGSPVPAGYGSLDGRPPERTDDDVKERKPFRWRSDRDDDDVEADSGPRTPVTHARTSDSEPARPAPSGADGECRSSTTDASSRTDASGRTDSSRTDSSRTDASGRTDVSARTEPPGQAEPAGKSDGRADGPPRSSLRPTVRPDGPARPLAPGPARTSDGPGRAGSGPATRPPAPGSSARTIHPPPSDARTETESRSRPPSPSRPSGGTAAPAPTNRSAVPEPTSAFDRPRARTVTEDDDPKGKRRYRVVPAGVPKERVDERGRIRRPTVTDPPTPEARPAAYMKETVRTRQVIRHLDIMSVLRVSLLFYFLVLVAMVFAGVILWNVASALGTIHSIDKSIKTLFDLKSFTLHPLPVLAYGTGAGVVLMFLGTFINVLVATIFNLISDVTGGVVVRVVAQPDDR